MINDEKYMQLAIAEAQKAYDINEVPVGAVIIKDGEIISLAHNTRETEQNATHHAELLAINSACKSLGTWRLTGCEIYVTLEPCPMCTGAIINSRLNRVVYGAADSAMGCCGSVANLCAMPFASVPLVKSRVLENECSELLKCFFAKLRTKNAESGDADA